MKIHHTAQVHPTAKIGKDVRIGENARLAADVRIGADAFVGKGAEEAIRQAQESRAIWRAVAERARQGHGHPLVVIFFGLVDLLRRAEDYRRGRTRRSNELAVKALRAAARVD